MTRLALLLAVVAALAFAAAADASTGSMIDQAMTRYAACRAPSGVSIAGGISSAYRGRYVEDLRLSNGAQMIVRYGRTRHVVIWITSHDVTYRLFTFRHARNVPRRLRSLCS